MTKQKPLSEKRAFGKLAKTLRSERKQAGMDQDTALAKVLANPVLLPVLKRMKDK